MNKSKKTIEVKVERIIPAPPVEVFEGWLNPKIPGKSEFDVYAGLPIGCTSWRSQRRFRGKRSRGSLVSTLRIGTASVVRSCQTSRSPWRSIRRRRSSKPMSASFCTLRGHQSRRR